MGEKEPHTLLRGKPEAKHHWEDPDVGGWITLR
jgi:hypothetical protein